jgi:hypothetical protein
VNLSDLQIVTGTAILIAGLAQINEISYYHEFLVSNYWFLALNSFWAASNVSRKSDDDEDDWWASTARTIAIVFSAILSITFQIITNMREQNHWNDKKEGKCYVSHDTSGPGQSWLWVAGLFVYGMQLVLSLISRTKKRFRPDTVATMKVPGAIGRVYRKYQESIERLTGSPRNYEILIASMMDLNVASHHLIVSLILTLDFLFQIICRVVWFCLLQFITVWAWGSGRYGFQVLVYMGFTAWSAYDIIDAKISNKYLLIGSESTWGFGQVLPVALLGMLLINAIDAFKVERCKHCKNCI